jgi:hypothetical protein
MSEPKFTPGPWAWKTLKDDSDFDALITGAGKEIFIYYTDEEVEHLSKPDAALIAAAPDLYDALELVLGTDFRDPVCCEKLFTLTQATLEKARGETK